ncbi:nuclease-related domain-containing protein [Streptomyces peucetius]|uniref:NERD domain-containing protein n=1 Tax=Streptomyces peucetius TaxID=1950 RepID=A0ABY6IF76_STRPE|nr:nuclease-related domain-containing protein [Streptomyces peucetius]UYQ64375.1 NERD domain-containing protein [Streptomyces peucetius]
MQRLRVTPVRVRGGDRLCVSLPDGRDVAWCDRDTGRVALFSAAHRDAVLQALAPFTAGELTVGPPPVPTRDELARLALPPDDDLAPNRPGEALCTDLERRPPAALRLRRDPRRADLAAQQRLGDALDGLEPAGWRVLHAVPLPGADHIDHLAFGPGGVLALHAFAADRTRVRVGDRLVQGGRGTAVDLTLTRRRADRAAHVLAVVVRPVLVVVGAARLDAASAPGDIQVLRDDEVPALARLGGVLKPADIESLYAAARDRRTWLAA